MNAPAFKKLLFGLCLAFIWQPLNAQKITLKRIEPAFWWANMKSPELQLLVHGDNIAQAQASLNYEGVELLGSVRLDSPNYLFLNLKISPNAKPGKFNINFQSGRKSQTYTYELKDRANSPKGQQGFSPADVMYLLMPDRFVNADPNNDNLPGMLEQTNREDLYGRFGGDIKGIIQHLDYIVDMGYTALWLNPVLENNMPKQSYHGYAITDFYKVDARFGSNEDYLKLIALCHEKGLKVVKDMVINHAGGEHWFVKDMPSKDWVHQFPEFTRSNYRGVMNVDPYVAQSDFELMKKGWFDTTMPDLNQRNPYLAKYLIQNSIWWIEYAGLDAIRMDTYSYPDRYFLADWAEAIFEEYPSFNIVGEVWEKQASTQAYWLSGSPNADGYDSKIRSITDFVIHQTLDLAFKEDGGWETGVSRLYYTLSQDRIYPKNTENVTFLDNHDVPRFYSTNDKNINRLKMALATLLTTRGVPQVYYGTEWLDEGFSHGEVRPETPGGWADHDKSIFTGKNLSSEQKDMMKYCKTLLNWRKKKKAIHEGKLIHFVPENGIYVYFRTIEDDAVMVVLNNKEEAQTLNTARFAECMQGYNYGWDVINGFKIDNLKELKLKAKSALILDLE